MRNPLLQQIDISCLFLLTPKWALETLLFGDVNQLIMLDMEPSDIWLTIISGIRWFLLDLLVYEFPTNCMFC